MNNLQVSACSLSVLLAAVAGQAPCASAVLFEKELLGSGSLNQLDVFGLTHTAAGNAQLSMSPTGTLVVSNIGSSGLDGVTVPIGDVRGNSMSMDFGAWGALAPGGLVEVLYPYSFGEQTIFVQAQPDGSARLGTGVCGGSGGAQPVCVSVEILDDGVVVGARDYLCGETDHFVSGDLGTDPATGEAMSFRFEQVGADYVHTVTLPASTALTLTGSITQTGDITETGDSVRITLGGLPPAETLSDPVRVLASNLGGDLEITGEQLILPLTQAREGDLPTWIWYPIAAGVQATGSSSIIGTPRTDVCDSYPFMWVQEGNLLSPLSGVTVSNIGSSGLDGVVIDFAGDTGCGPGFFMCPDGSCVADPAACSTEVVDRAIHFGGNSMIAPDYLDLDSDGDSLRIGAVGSIGGGTGSGLGSIQFVHEPGTIGELALYTDFAPIGATLVRVEVYQDGAFVGEFEEFEREATILASISHPPTGIDLTGCGKLGGDILGPPCFFFTTQNPVTVNGGGQALVGNEVRVLAVDVATPIEFISALSLTGTNLEDFDLRLDAAGDHADFENALGRRHMAEGNATVSTNPDGHLVVSNIGSSGLDGVSMDPWDTEMVQMQLRAGGDFPPDSFFDIALRTWWPDCDDDGSIMSVRAQATTPDQLTLTATHIDPTLTMQVTLFSPDGTPLRSIPMTQAQSLLLSDPAGVGLEVKLMDFGLSRGSDGGYVECMTTHLISDPGGAGGGGRVTVQSPDGVSTHDVGSVEVCSSRGIQGRRPHADITIKRGIVDPGGGGGGNTPMSDMEIELVALNAFDMPTSSLGAAKFWWKAKASGGELSAAEQALDDCYRLSVANIGSSGLDGVRFHVNEEQCNGVDDDCDSEVEGAWVDFQSMDHNGNGEIKVIVVGKKSPPGVVVPSNSVYWETSIVPGPTGSGISVSVTDDVDTTYVFGVRIEVWDAAGALIAFEDENLYPTIPNHSSPVLNLSLGWDRGVHEASFDFGNQPQPLGGVLPHYTTFQGVRHGLRTPQPVTLTRSGQVVQNASEYRITLIHDAPILIDHLASMDLRFSDSSSQGGSYNLFGAGVSRVAPPSCPADLNNDGFLDSGDISAFVAGFLAGDPAVDFNNDGFFDSGDISGFVEAFLAGC